ncbi:hypothetical protein GP486_003145 [Trichoglossum hirsutum]|uniref:alpha-amylase n=1 Tax=Trichoglossum hirsutum TaxID=265104 RepID=A0A9P8LDP2_9PEZI|nr:hypothetical protein GP486_003145 [Trichoglossum hirsutum]
MVDVVVNHVGYAGAPETVDYSGLAKPFDGAHWFHPYCPIRNYDNQTEVEQCWLGDHHVSLPDINTRLPAVQSFFRHWISDLVANYSIDGLRIDTVKHVQKGFWKGFNDAAGVYCLGEALHGDQTLGSPKAPLLFPHELMRQYRYYALLRAFTPPDGDMGELVRMMWEVQARCRDTSLLGTFSENHDQPRFPHFTSDMALQLRLTPYTLVYQGQEQHFRGSSDPSNREPLWPTEYRTTTPLYQHISILNRLRRHAILSQPSPGIHARTRSIMLYADRTTLVVRKADLVAVYSNRGEGSGRRFVSRIAGVAAPGSTLVDVLRCGVEIVDAGGAFSLVVDSGLPKVSQKLQPPGFRVLTPTLRHAQAFYPAFRLQGSGICGY